MAAGALHVDPFVFLEVFVDGSDLRTPECRQALLAIFSAAHVVAAKFGWAEVQQVGDKKRIPLAPSVAAALILSFILGCLQPMSH